ncbi:MAG: hypothetical protein ACK4NF_00965 [Planctomycetota bacterium]
MRNFILIAIALFVSIILFFVLLIRKKQDEKKIKNIIQSISSEAFNQKIEQAISFLRSKYDKTYIFRDPYLMCIEQAKGCESNWRVLMLAQNIIYEKYEDILIEELPEIFRRAKEIEELEYKRAKRRALKNYPVEIYCNFSRGHPDNMNFVKEIINGYSERLKGWRDINYYTPLWQWRKIWDESFCTAALANVEEAKHIVENVLDNHYNVYLQKSAQKVENIWKYKTSLVDEIDYLVRRGFNCDNKYLEFVKNYFNELKDEFLKREKNDWRYALLILGTIKDFPDIVGKGTSELIKDSIISIVNGIDNDGMLSVWRSREGLSRNRYISGATIYTLNALDIIFYFKGSSSNY